MQPPRRSANPAAAATAIIATPPTPKVTIIQNEPAIMVKDDMSEDSDEFADTLDGACGGYTYDDEFEKSE